MSISLCFTPLISQPRQTPARIPLFKPLSPVEISARPKFTYSRFSSSINYGVNENFENLAAVVPPDKQPRWESWLATAASLYPVYVTVGGVVAFLRPSTFSWFVDLGPTSYSLTLGFIMLAMGITLELKELVNLFRQRPLSILFGCAAQYTIMPAFGMVVSKLLGLSPSLSVGLILLSCCPGGTASNVVTLIAQGDVPLSIVMTVCTTLGAVILTPLLTKILAGTYVPVNAVDLSVSTLQVVVAPILLGSYLQSTFPEAVKLMTPFAPLIAVLSSSLLACSVFSENVVRLKSSVIGASLSSNPSPILHAQALLSSRHAKLLVGSGFSYFSFHLTHGRITLGYVGRNYEHHGQQSRFLLEVLAADFLLVQAKMSENFQVEDAREDIGYSCSLSEVDAVLIDTETSQLNWPDKTMNSFMHDRVHKSAEPEARKSRKACNGCSLSPPSFDGGFRPPSLLEQQLLPVIKSDDTAPFSSSGEKSKSAQLTIFYKGEINVYDNVSADKARAVMVLACESSLSAAVVKNAVVSHVPMTRKESVPPASNSLLTVTD
ncbi:UNVERIFIED_CONTAM: Sodium/pyruvate cotransporter BASS2, chloroplastic [Sesamum latifolium]|uniref:Sodium/pyruvate cotransporter BASS2, chloroplastic n=1 Tax=Sesamum latifolium TaxID=2727402 RepID=A0AAW2XJU4_9LAMI